MARKLVVGILLVFGLHGPIGAQAGESPPGAGPAPLVLGTKVAPPFAMKGEDGAWSGITIELLRGLAADLGRELEIRETSLDGMFQGLERGELDLAASALTITADREERVDFSQPYIDSGLGIATSEEPQGWLAVARRLVAWEFVRVVLGLLALLLAVGCVVWLFERGRNPEQFGGKAAHGLGSGLWWSAVTMTTVGYGDKAPVTVGGRIVALLWMFASLIAISTFTAAIASSLTVGSLTPAVRGPQDLPRALVAGIPGTTGAAYLDDEGISYRSFDTPEDAVRSLAAGETDAVVSDAPILAYLIRKLDVERVEVLPERLDTQAYGIALPQGSPLREPLDRALLRRVQSDEWERTVEAYLGE